MVVIVVPTPDSVSTLNSSISLLTPGIPAPSPPEVEEPSSITLRMSEIPGPLSDAMIVIPYKSSSEVFISILPFPAYK